MSSTRQKTGANWLVRGWSVVIFLTAVGLAFLVLCTKLATDRAWFLLALLAVGAGLPLVGRITEISAFGITAKLRAEVQKAEEAIQNLRALAAMAGGEMIRNLVASAYMYDHQSFEDKLDTRDSILTLLHQMGVDGADIERADGSSKVYIAFWYHDAIRKTAFSMLSAEKTGQFTHDFDAKRDFKGLIPANPYELERVLSDHGVLNEQTREWLSCYSRFLASGVPERRKELSVVMKNPRG